jgi:hypothetical protein
LATLQETARLGVEPRILQALRHAKLAIWTMALVYVLSVLVGLLLVHSGNRYSLNYRDKLIGKAYRESVISRQLQHGRSLTAAALDASANAAAGFLSIPAGYCPPAGYGVAAFRGWIGGIVSVDDNHRSRLATSFGAFYYLTTLLLQLIPFSLTGGAGVNVGIASFANENRSGYHGPRVPWLRIPYEAMRDAGWIYLFSLPLFAVASLFEFLMS